MHCHRILFLLLAFLVFPYACDSGGSGPSLWGGDVATGADSSTPGEDVASELPPACENECGFFGEKECVGPEGWRECVPEGTCLVWGEAMDCDPGTTCEDSECIQLFGDLDCLGITSCMGQCDEDEACQQACFKEGSEQGQADWTDLAVCIDDACGDLFAAEKPAAGGKCTLEQCKEPYLVCTPVGSASCNDSLQCLQGCNGDNACLGACALDADYDALVELADILVCFEENCPDPADWEACATTTCLGPVLGCL